MPSNWSMANVVLQNLHLSFQGQTFQVAILTNKRWKPQTLLLKSDKKWGICHKIAQMRILDIDIRFQGHEFWNVNISNMVRATTKYSRMTFIEVDIYNGMGKLRMLYSVTLPSFSRSNNFLLCIYNKCAGNGCLRQIYLITHGFRCLTCSCCLRVVYIVLGLLHKCIDY